MKKKNAQNSPEPDSAQAEAAVEAAVETLNSIFGEESDFYAFWNKEDEDGIKVNQITGIPGIITMNAFVLADNNIVEDDSLTIDENSDDKLVAKYSFPSKNMEYMVSGTPVLTTRLPGMPMEYYPYVYFIEEESADGIAAAKEKEIMEV